MNYNFKKYYSITISPPARNRHLERYRAHRKIFRKYIKKCSNLWMLCPEFDVNERLHYHGVIRIDKLPNWYKKVRPKIETLGYIDCKRIKTFKSHLRWLCYCYKKHHCIKELFPRCIPKHPKRLTTRNRYTDISGGLGRWFQHLKQKPNGNGNDAI